MGLFDGVVRLPWPPQDPAPLYVNGPFERTTPQMCRRPQNHLKHLSYENGLHSPSELRAVGIVLEDDGADDVDLHNLLLWQQVCDRADYELGSSSEGASVGALTRTHRVNDRSAATFDMDAFAQALSNFTSQNVHNANVRRESFGDCKV